MAEFELQPDLFVTPTPAGAYYASASPDDEPARRVLFGLMQTGDSPLLSLQILLTLTGTDELSSLELLYRMQEMGLLQGFSECQQVPGGPLDQALPAILQGLAGDGKALLADSQGFYVSSHGYHHETAEELSALSADLGLLHQRHHRLLNRNMSLPSSAWAVVGAGGHSEVGFWPLYIGRQRFVLVLSGVPNLHQPELVELVWVLSTRYAGA